MDPKYVFPAQEECIEAVCDLIKREVTSKTSFLDKWTSVKRAKTINQRVLIVVGAYKIGKERVFYSKRTTHLMPSFSSHHSVLDVAKMLDSKIYVTDDRRQILECQENKDIADRLIDDPLKAQIHVVQLNHIKGDVRRKESFLYYLVY
jgi:DNA cross-link repair 1A protein